MHNVIINSRYLSWYIIPTVLSSPVKPTRDAAFTVARQSFGAGFRLSSLVAPGASPGMGLADPLPAQRGGGCVTPYG